MVEQYVSDLLKKSKKLFGQKNGKRAARFDPLNGQSQLEQLAECHACLLGLRAYLLSVPSGISELIPKVLLSIIKAQNYPNPLGQTVKDTIKDYKSMTLYEHPDDIKSQFEDDDW